MACWRRWYAAGGKDKGTTACCPLAYSFAGCSGIARLDAVGEIAPDEREETACIGDAAFPAAVRSVPSCFVQVAEARTVDDGVAVAPIGLGAERRVQAGLAVDLVGLF